MATYTWSGTAPENPISDGGKWVTTMPSSWTTVVQTVSGTPNFINGPNSSAANDSVAFLTGFGSNQTITATVFNGGAHGAAEVELHLRGTIDIAGNTIKTYEIDFIPNACVVARWNGAQGATTDLSAGGFGAVGNFSGNLNDGQVVVAAISGPANAVVITVTVDGTLIGTANDSTGYATGQPGIGFDAGTPANGALFGWKAYSVTDGIAPPAGPTVFRMPQIKMIG